MAPTVTALIFKLGSVGTLQGLSNELMFDKI